MSAPIVTMGAPIGMPWGSAAPFPVMNQTATFGMMMPLSAGLWVGECECMCVKEQPLKGTP
jgi:hypothetical protein